MQLKRYLILFFLVLIFLIPKIYYLVLSYNNNYYTEANVYNSGDETHYLLIGKNISKYGVYADNDSNKATESATWRPPIWPIILAGFFLLSNNILTIIILKFILELGLILFAFHLLRHYGKKKIVYILPFLLLLIEPQYLKYSISFLSESITAVFMLLLVVCFILFSESKKYSITIILLSLLVILCHPVSAFFVAFLLLFYGLLNIKKDTKRVILHAVIFILVFSIWPLRNNLTFNKGYYLTASQGATFAKGWNSEVLLKFNNTDGDLADEQMNLKYLNLNQEESNSLSILGKSKLYKKATKKFMASLSVSKTLEIGMKKLKSNFNPFQEKPKDIFLEKVAVLFRIIYLLTFIQVFILLFYKKRKRLNPNIYKACLAIIAIVIGQVIMAVYIYTGLRFNAIYGLSILFLALFINYKFIINILESLSSKIKLLNT